MKVTIELTEKELADLIKKVTSSVRKEVVDIIARQLTETINWLP